MSAVLLGAVCVVVLVGCGSPSATRGPTATPNVGSADEKPYETQQARIAATATVVASRPYSSDGISVKVVETVLNRGRVHGDVPELFQVLIHSGGTKDRRFSSSDFACVDQVGNVYGMLIHSLKKRALGSGRLRSGETRRGWIGCEVPRSTSELAVTWSNGSELSPPIEVARYDLLGRPN